jgi:hypothetical protein
MRRGPAYGNAASVGSSIKSRAHAPPSIDAALADALVSTQDNHFSRRRASSASGTTRAPMSAHDRSFQKVAVLEQEIRRRNQLLDD